MSIYIITVTHRGHLPRVYLKEATDITAAFLWANARWPERHISIHIQCLLLPPDDAVGTASAANSTGTAHQEASHA